MKMRNQQSGIFKKKQLDMAYKIKKTKTQKVLPSYRTVPSQVIPGPRALTDLHRQKKDDTHQPQRLIEGYRNRHLPRNC